MSATTVVIRIGAWGLSALYLSAWIATGDSVFSIFPAGVVFGVAAVRWDDWVNSMVEWAWERKHSAIDQEDTP